MLRGLLICAAMCALALAPGAGQALAAPSDAAATTSFVQADYALVHAARSRLRAEEAAPLKILHRVNAECPGAATRSPQNVQSEHLSNEVIGAIVLEAAKLDAVALKGFLRAAAPLRWGTASLNRTMHGYVTKLTRLSKLSVPDVCSDVKAWVSSGFVTLPQSTVKFDDVFLPNWVKFGFLPSALARSESASTRSLAQKAKAIESQLVDGEARAVDHWADILNALELGP